MPEGWVRRAPLAPSAARHEELWELWSHGSMVASLPVRVQVGKALDVLGLRDLDPDAQRVAADEVVRAAAELYGAGTPADTARPCPCCGAPPAEVPAAVVAGAAYARCSWCAHMFIASLPSFDALTERFRASAELAAVYTDPAATEARMSQIVAPKLEWALEVAARAGIEPESALDVGAGAGHFVAGATARGLHAVGYELNGPCCEFAAAALGADLRHRDFLSAEPGGEHFDLITLWGVLEYAPYPRAVLAHAARWLAPGGLLVVEVPRADSLSTALQRAIPNGVARHLDPSSHLNVFSDASLATALWSTGFAPTDAWYFGMDAFELLTQLASAVDEDGLDRLIAPLLSLQPALDAAVICDDLVLAAVAGPAAE